MTGRRSVLDEVVGLRALAAEQLGVVRRDQLAALGVTRHHVRSQLAAGRWRELGPVLVVLRTGALTRAQEMVAGPLHCGPTAALDGWTQLERAGLRGWTRPGVDVVVPHGTRPPPLPGLVVHQSRQLPELDIVPGTPRSVTVARAAIDAAGRLRSPRAACGLVLAVAQQRLATAAEMLTVLERTWRVRHTVALRELLSDAEGLESQAERDVERIARSVGFSDVRRQEVVETPGGPVRVDLALRLADGRVVLVEVDGPSHDEPLQRLADAERDAALIALGYVVLRIPAYLVRTDPDAVRARFTALWGPSARSSARSDLQSGGGEGVFGNRSLWGSGFVRVRSGGLWGYEQAALLTSVPPVGTWTRRDAHDCAGGTASGGPAGSPKGTTRSATRAR